MTSRRSSGSMRAESAVEPTRSENITVTWRRSAVSWGCGSVNAGCRVGGLGCTFRTSARAIARSILRRCPSETPKLLQVLIGQIGKNGDSISFSAKRCAYSDMPSFSSQSAICCIAATSGFLIASASGLVALRVYPTSCKIEGRFLLEITSSGALTPAAPCLAHAVTKSAPTYRSQGGWTSTGVPAEPSKSSNCPSRIPPERFVGASRRWPQD